MHTSQLFTGSGRSWHFVGCRSAAIGGQEGIRQPRKSPDAIGTRGVV
jgi:hypothetical protein